MKTKLGSKASKLVNKPANVKKERATITDVTEYKGSPIFGIHDKERHEAEDQFATIVQFGVRKAKAVLKHIDELKEFVEEYGQE